MLIKEHLPQVVPTYVGATYVRQVLLVLLEATRKAVVQLIDRIRVLGRIAGQAQR